MSKTVVKTIDMYYANNMSNPEYNKEVVVFTQECLNSLVGVVPIRRVHIQIDTEDEVTESMKMTIAEALPSGLHGIGMIKFNGVSSYTDKKKGFLSGVDVDTRTKVSEMIQMFKDAGNGKLWEDDIDELFDLIHKRIFIKTKYGANIVNQVLEEFHYNDMDERIIIMNDLMEIMEIPFRFGYIDTEDQYEIKEV